MIFTLRVFHRPFKNQPVVPNFHSYSFFLCVFFTFLSLKIHCIYLRFGILNFSPDNSTCWTRWRQVSSKINGQSDLRIISKQSQSGMISIHPERYIVTNQQIKQMLKSQSIWEGIFSLPRSADKERAQLLIY